MIKEFLTPQFRIFLLTGGTAAAVNIGSRVLFNQWMSFSSAVILAYLMGMITAFVLARLFVFKESTQSVGRSIAIFTLVNAVAVLQTWGISMLLRFYLLPAMHLTLFVPEIAHIVGVIVPVFTSYIGHKRWSFK